MKKFLALSILFSLPTFAQTIDPDKFTICAATINSSDEIDMIKKQLDPKKFNPVVELTEMGSTANWFDKACKSGIRCDQLVISGHFTGHFYGEKKFHVLGLDELEEKSCAKTCDGILKSPLEVFLLGCNTLATKELDHRTPEQYFQVLLGEGLNSTEARRITDARYGDLGESNRARMQAVFGDNKKIYGFSSTGPLGSVAKKYVSNYLAQVDMSSHLEKLSYDKMLNKMDFTNKALKNSFKGTSFQECEGFSDEDPVMKLKCKLIDPKSSQEEKLLVIEEMFSKDNFLSYVPLINREIEKTDGIDLSEASEGGKEVFLRLKNNNVVKEQLLGVAKKSPSLGTSAEMFSLLETFQMVSSDDSNSFLKEKVELVLKNPLKAPGSSTFCEKGIVNIGMRKVFQTTDVKNIHESYYKNVNGLIELECLSAISPSVVDKLISLPRSTPEYNKERASVIALAEHDSDDVAGFLVKEYKSNVFDKKTLFLFLGGTNSEIPEVKSTVDEEIVTGGDELSHALMYYEFGNREVVNPRVKDALGKIAKGDSIHAKRAASILTN